MELIKKWKSKVLEVFNNISTKIEGKINFGNINWKWKSPIVGSYVYLSTIILLLIVLVAVIYYLYRKYGASKVVVKSTKVTPSGRVRKRDKVLMYGQKVLRKVKMVSGEIRNSGQRKRKRLISVLSKGFNKKLDRKPAQLNIQEPPMEYLHEEFVSGSQMPLDALCLLRGIRVFGNIDKPIFLKIFKYTETLNLNSGDYLFKLGQLDENFFVVQSGAVNICLTASSNSVLSLRVVKPGESVTSLLSFLEMLTDTPKPYKTIFARVTKDSVILKIPMKAFELAFKEYPHVYRRVIQIIMTRVQRVFFTALHQHLALSSELVNSSTKKRSMSVVSKVGSEYSPRISRSEPYPPDLFMSNDLGGPVSRDEIRTHPEGSSVHDKESKKPVDKESKKPTVKEEVVEEEEEEDNKQSDTREPSTSPITSDSEQKEGKDEVDAVVLNAKHEFLNQIGVSRVTPDMLKEIEYEEVPGNMCFVKEEYNNDYKLIYVIEGALYVTQKAADGKTDVHLFTAFPDDIIGGLAVLTSDASVFTISTKLAPAKVVYMAKETIAKLIDSDMEVLISIAHTVLSRLSPFVRQFDFALDWVFLESGQAVYRQDDESDATYILLSGRLRSIKTVENGKRREEGEYAKGDLVGLIEMVTGTTRNTTVMAVRDSELAKLPDGLFNAMKLRFPSVVSRLMYILGRKVVGAQNMTNSKGSSTLSLSNLSQESHNTFNFSPHASGISTLAIVAVNPDVPITTFSYELSHSVNKIVPTTVITSQYITKLVGQDEIDQNNYKLTNWLAMQEDRFKICIYVCDPDFTPWTQRCLRQADCILLVGLGAKQPTVGVLEHKIEKITLRIRKELVLLHIGDEKPHNTVEWLNLRKGVSAHHHIRCSKRMIVDDVNDYNYYLYDLYNKIDSSEPSFHSDFSRLARWITGTSIGLVLGGGGARGCAHIGMIKSLLEAKIPIDMIGGVSIGSFVSGLWAMYRDIDEVSTNMELWCKDVYNMFYLIWDLTYPVVSILSGKHFNSCIDAVFKNTQIEDLWIPYFCVTTDITASGMRIHTHGSLWRYIRASMSLSWYTPPLCDPLDSHMLLDGGYVNNLPADVMKALGAKIVIAVDVGSQDETDLHDYGDYVNGWWVLLRRLSPFHQTLKVLAAADIQSRLAYVSCVRQLEEVKNSDYCKYVRPPIDQFTTFQFKSFHQIKEIGYNHGKKLFPDETSGKAFLTDTLSGRKSEMFNSYVNLAEILYAANSPTSMLDEDGIVSEEEEVSEQDLEDYESDTEETTETDGPGPSSDPGTREKKSKYMIAKRAIRKRFTSPPSTYRISNPPSKTDSSKSVEFKRKISTTIRPPSLDQLNRKVSKGSYENYLLMTNSNKTSKLKKYNGL